MTYIWFVPVTITVVACLLGYRWYRLLDDELTSLRAELKALPVLASRTRAVRRQADRVAQVTDTTSEVFGGRR